MPRKTKKYHYLYKTTNKITEQYYIGVHSTNNLDDGYSGSGKRLYYSLKKYGKEQFNFEILEFLPNRILLLERENEIVNNELLNDPLCLNIKNGGDGGGFINEEHRKKCQAAGGRAVRLMFSKIHQVKMKTDPEYREKCVSKIRGNKTWLGKHHTEETKKKMSTIKKGKYKGEENSQYGTCWITNGKENKKIKKEELHIYEDNGWKKGRMV